MFYFNAGEGLFKVKNFVKYVIIALQFCTVVVIPRDNVLQVCLSKIHVVVFHTC